MNLSKETFVATIVGKMPQAQSPNIEQFYDFHTSQGCPSGFLDRVSQTFRYIGNAEWENVAGRSAAVFNGILNDHFKGDYILLIDNARSSVRWAYEQLLKQGLIPARKIYNESGSHEHIYTPWQDLEHEESHVPLLISDDWAIGGADMEDYAFTGVSERRQNFFLMPFFSSRNALKRIYKANSNANVITLGEPIETLDEALSEVDCDYLKNLYEQTRGTKESFDEGMFKQFALVTSSHFTPDNFPGLFLGKRRFADTEEPVPGLIRPQRPNYRRWVYSNSLHGRK